MPTYPTDRMPGISHVGRLVRGVADAALMLTVISQPDDLDWQALPPCGRDYRIGLDDGIAGWRIAYSRTLGYATPDDDVVACVDRAGETLRDLGATVVECDSGFAEPRAAFDAMWGANLAAYARRHPRGAARGDGPYHEAAGKAGRRYIAEELMVSGMQRAAPARHMIAFYRDWDLLVTPTSRSPRCPPAWISCPAAA